MEMSLKGILLHVISSNIMYFTCIFIALASVPFVYHSYAMFFTVFIDNNIHLKALLNSYFIKLILLYVFMNCAHFFAIYFIGKVMPNIKNSILKIVMDRLYNTQISHINVNESEITRSISDIVENIKDFLIYILQFLCEPIVTILVSLYTTTVKGLYWVAMISILWISFILIFLYILAISNTNAIQMTSTSQQITSGIIGDIVRNITLARTFEARPLEKKLHTVQINEGIYENKMFLNIGSFKGILATLNTSSFIFICYYMVNFVQITQKDYLVSVSLFRGVLLSLWSLIVSSTDITRKLLIIQTSIQRINELPVELSKKHINMKPTKSIVEHQIEIANLTFRYPNQVHNIFENANLIIRPGDRVILYGKSGAGKSTIINMIAGLIRPPRHSILLDGMDINDIDQKWLTNNITYVSQNQMIYNASVLENITLDKPYNKDKLDEVCTLCGVYEFTNNLPENMHTNVGVNGNNLSGGQLQRISIARALLFDKPHKLLIFDEILNHIDKDTREQIVELVESICRGRTTIIISHTEDFNHLGTKILFKNKQFFPE